MENNDLDYIDYIEYLESEDHYSRKKVDSVYHTKSKTMYGNLLEIKDTGFCGGDSGHGGFVEILINNFSSLDIECETIENKFNTTIRLKFSGDWERTELRDMCEYILAELEKTDKENE